MEFSTAITADGHEGRAGLLGDVMLPGSDQNGIYEQTAGVYQVGNRGAFVGAVVQALITCAQRLSKGGDR